MDLIERACADVALQLQKDPTAALNESELQALLQTALLKLIPSPVPAELGPGVIRRSHHPDLLVQRVFRELKPDGGKSGKEADLLILEDRPQVVEAKLNGAPARFCGPFEAIIETKIDASATAMLSGRPVRPRVDDLLSDLAKWRGYREAGLVRRVVAIVMTADPDAYSGLQDVIAIPRTAAGLLPWTATAPIDPWPQIDDALEAVADEYKKRPLGCIREKDFESRLFSRLRSLNLPRSSLPVGNGMVSIDPVRAQWSGTWSAALGRGRRHDLVVLHPNGLSLMAELELKTSHSDSHNWFRKREVEAELQAMQRLTEEGLLSRGRFVMFRYGLPMWEEDARVLFEQFPKVEFAYYAS